MELIVSGAKGVDVRIATDMISLAWANNYDIAVLISSDQDFLPVAEFLETRGIKVIHGVFPPSVSVPPSFQLPTSLNCRVAPRAMSLNRERPRHMTMFPGGGSLARSR